jgi:MFS family permease
MAQGEAATARSFNDWLVLTISVYARFTLTVNLTLMNVALPAIQQAFSLTSATLQWILTAYVVPFGGFLLSSGCSTAFFGQRRTLLSRLTVFTLLSPGLLNIAFRALQGLAGASMATTEISPVLLVYTEGNKRASGSEVFSAPGAIAGCLGVVLGDLITPYPGWRWPAGLPDHPDLMQASNSSPAPGSLESGAGDWWAPGTIGALLSGCLALLAFVFNGAWAAQPLMQLKVFRIQNMLAANALILLNTALFFATLYTQNILSYTLILSGLDFLPCGLIYALRATIVPRLSKKVGYKAIPIVAPLLMVVGLFLESTIPVQGSYQANMAPGMFSLSFDPGAPTVIGGARTGSRSRFWSSHHFSAKRHGSGPDCHYRCRCVEHGAGLASGQGVAGVKL